jgi:nitrogen regulatory protein PII
MFQITAVLNRSTIDDIVEDLIDEGIPGVTVSDVLGKGCYTDMENDLTEKAMIFVIVRDEINKEKAMEAIRANAQTMEKGSGKMWVTPVVEVERLRTGEKNGDALSSSTPVNSSSTITEEHYDPIDTPAS